MSVSCVVVDGSNLATEGRTAPSLRQLEDVVQAFVEQYEPGKVIVLVDATFPNRIHPEELADYEAAALAGKVVAPPAGVIGRGDAFVLEVAERAGAVVLSNDSFQEFHGQFPWLFEQGRLIGGKPVPHVGWVFMDRAPVRGPQSRKAVGKARKAQAAPPAAAPAAEQASPDPQAARTRRRRKGAPDREQAGDRPPSGLPTPAGATVEPTPAPPAKPAANGRRRRGAAGEPAVEPYNEALPFIEFVAAHPVRSTVEGEIERFASHGAYVVVEGTRCYLPLKHIADPPPRAARELLKLGQRLTFEVHAFDIPRRGVDLAIPGVIAAAPDRAPEEPSGPPAAVAMAGESREKPTEEERVAPAKQTPARKAVAKKTVAKKTVAGKAVAKKAVAKKAVAKKAVAKKAVAKKAVAGKAVAKKAVAKKAVARKAVAKKAVARKAVAKRAAAKKPAVS